MSRERVIERSVIQVGESALAVTLPSWWVKTHNVKQKSRVLVEAMADGSLKISPKRVSSKNPLSATVRVSGARAEASIVREVVALYLAGFTRIRIEYTDNSMSKATSVTRTLEEVMLGLTLVDEGEDYMEYYVAVDPEAIGFWEALEREYNVTLSMLRVTLDSITRRDVEGLRGVADRDALVDRLYLYARRKVNMVLLGLEAYHTLGVDSLAEVPSLVMAVKNIERVADHTVIISGNAATLLESGGSVSDEALSMVKGAYSVFELTGRALLGTSRKAAEEAAEVIDKYPSRKIPAPKGRSPEEVLIIDSSRRILAYSLDLAEAIYDLNSVRLAVKSTAPAEASTG